MIMKLKRIFDQQNEEIYGNLRVYLEDHLGWICGGHIHHDQLTFIQF